MPQPFLQYYRDDDLCSFYAREDIVDHIADHDFVAAFGICQDSNGKIVLTQHHHRGREIPAGRREEGETILDNVLREVREETGGEMINPVPRAVILRDNQTTGKKSYGPVYVGTRTNHHYELIDDAVGMGTFDREEMMTLFTAQDAPETLKLIEYCI